MFINVLRTSAGVAQLVEHNLAKVDVAGSSPVSRSKNPLPVDFVVYGDAPASRSFNKGWGQLQAVSGPVTEREFAKPIVRLVLKIFLFGGVAKRSKAKVCKTFIHRFESDRRL